MRSSTDPTLFGLNLSKPLRKALAALKAGCRPSTLVSFGLPLRVAAGAAFLAAVSLTAAADGPRVRIDHPYARPTFGGAPGGAFMTIDNPGPRDRLLSISTDVATDAELHEMRMEGDVMRMRQLDGIDLPTGSRVSLAPGKLHVMLLGLHAPLKAGQRFPLHLRFEKAGKVTVQVAVEPAAARETLPTRR